MHKFVYMEAKTVKIFARENSPRLRYVTDLVMNEILGLPWEIVTDKRKLGKNPIINYSDDNIPGCFMVTPSGLLFESGVSFQEISVSYWNTLPVFYQAPGNPDLPFDIFAAVFFLVSRYEEYLEFNPDEFGRFPSSYSLASKNNFLEIPVVDLWVKEFAKCLVRRYPNLTFRRNVFKAQITFDIDEAFEFLGKSIIGNIGNLLHYFTMHSKHESNKPDESTSREKDPYEIYDYLTGSAEKNCSDIRFFFPVGNSSPHDRNPSWRSKEYRNLIKKIASKYITGIHPSFKASFSLPVIMNEIKRMRTILASDCTLSRFHYLRIDMPSSYRNIEKAGISEDYSMGYSDAPGFRAGIARSFRFFDVIENRMTDLRIFPFQVMDITLKEHRNLSPDEAMGVISRIVQNTKMIGGLFISIWHNTSLLDTPEGRDWRNVFEFTLREQLA